MIDRALGFAGLGVTIISFVGAILFPSINKKLAWGGFVVGLLMIGAATAALFTGEPSAQTYPPVNGNCNNFGNNNTNCNTFNFGPPRTPDGIYYRGERIGSVQGIEPAADGKTVTLINPRISTSLTEINGPFELQRETISCPDISSIRMRGSTTSIAINGKIVCDVISQAK